jgi:integrase
VQLAAGNSSRTVTLAHNALTRALRHAEVNHHVVHDVATLVDTPKGQPGRPSKALTIEQAAAVLEAAERSRLGAYVVLCLMTGIRTEEARALRWDHVNLDAASMAVWRSVRLGGDTKTSTRAGLECSSGPSRTSALAAGRCRHRFAGHPRRPGALHPCSVR